MIEELNRHSVKLDWIGAAPNSGKKFAMLIPQYNEALNCNLEERLLYFKKVAKENENIMDVIIIDDGSTDDSLDKIKQFTEEHPGSFFVASVFPNANKIGALFMTTLKIKHDFVVLSDFDTDISGLTKEFDSLKEQYKDDNLMGSYFRMLPYEGQGIIFLWQQLEYALARSLYKFHQKEKSVPVMPGAGSCYKREILNTIYYEHSGLRNGEDREASVVGLKLGYKVIYSNKILALTRPPLCFKNLVKQRIRWNLGYLETFFKEKKYYFSQMIGASRIGISTLMDFVFIAFIVLLPLTILFFTIMDIYLLFYFLAVLYIINVAWCVNLLLLSPNESVEFKEKRLSCILVYPLIKLSLECLAWIGAIMTFIRKKPNNIGS